MAIQWGAVSGHVTLGVDVSMSPATVTKDTTSVTVVWKFYGKDDPSWYRNDNVTLTTSGSISNSYAYHVVDNSGGATYLIATVNQTVPLTYASQVQTGTGSLTGLSGGGNPKVTAKFTVPARPPQVPSPATGVTATRVTDNKVTVSWTRPANAGTASSIWAQTVITRTSVMSSVPVTVATLTGTGQSWTDTSTTANMSYVYRVQGKNASGSSALASSGTVYTTPTAPTGATATRFGTNILVSWTDQSPANTAWQINDNGQPVTAGFVGQPPYTHTNPDPSVAHVYTVQAVAGSLTGPASQPSNTVNLITPPAAPTNLAPAQIPTGQPSVLTWRHNALDSSDQSAYEVLYSLDGGTTWTDTGKVTSSASSWPVPAAAYANAGTVQWQVRTWGLHADPSPYSAVLATTVATAPSATISAPVDGAVLNGSECTIQWGYYQAEGKAQVGYLAQVIDASTGDPVWSMFGADSRSQVTATGLQDGASYSIAVKVQSSDGVWSPVASVTVSVSYARPAAPQVTIVDNLQYGNVELIVQAVDDGTSPATVQLTVERMIDDGPWVTLMDTTDDYLDMIDWTPTVGGLNTYRVTATSALPSSATVTQTIAGTTGTACSVVISGGPGFARSVTLAGADTADLTVGRDRSLLMFAGRTKPVEVSGLGVAKSVAVTAALVTERQADPDFPAVDPAELEELFSLPGPHLYRDSNGRYMFCSLSQVKIPARDLEDVSFTVTETDPGTQEQRDSIATYTGPYVAEAAPGEYVIIGGTTLEAAPGEYVWTSEQVSTVGS